MDIYELRDAQNRSRNPAGGNYTKELEEGIRIQGPQERTLTPVPSDENDEDMSLEQIRCIRRFRKGGKPSTALGVGVTNLKALKG
jgi:hypothetical protein